VDFNGNHRIELFREPGDAIGSVANYLQIFGWDTGRSNAANPASGKAGARVLPPVAVRVQVPGNNIAGEAAATRTLAAWTAAGVTPVDSIAPGETARMVDFTLADGKEYWLVFNNFEVIARYNNSDFYAMSVFQLAEALKAARKGAAGKPEPVREPSGKS
jgi:membrane-bound lytic murein transglycosylase B